MWMQIRDKVSRCSADVNLELQRASNDGVLSYESMRMVETSALAPGCLTFLADSAQAECSSSRRGVELSQIFVTQRTWRYTARKGYEHNQDA